MNGTIRTMPGNPYPQGASWDGAGVNEPLSTYRIQMNSQFGFDDAAKIIPYLEELGY